jgi:hypothetical protein
MWANLTLMCHMGHQGDIILYSGSKKKIFQCKSNTWDQHDIFKACKQNTIGGPMLTGLLVLHS